MQTLIKKYLSELFDNLLQKALEEKPDVISKNAFSYNYLFSVCVIDKNLYDIIIAVRKSKESIGNHISYVYDLTAHQKEMIDKIFKKWGAGMTNTNIQIQDFKGKIIAGYDNTWSAFAEEQYNGKRYFLLENDEYGDEAAYLFYDVAENTVIGETFVGFSELPELIDNGIHIMRAPLIY